MDGLTAKSRCYLEWEVFENGSVVEVILGDGRDAGCGGVLPPSLSTGDFGVPPA